MGRILPEARGLTQRERKVIDFARTSSFPLQDAAAAVDLVTALSSSPELFALLQGAIGGVTGLFERGPQVPQFPQLPAVPPVAQFPATAQEAPLAPPGAPLPTTYTTPFPAAAPVAPVVPTRQELLDEAALLAQNYLFQGGDQGEAVEVLVEQGATPEEAETVVARAADQLRLQREEEERESLLPEFLDPDQEDIARLLLAGTKPSDIVRERLKVEGADKAAIISEVRATQEALAANRRVQQLAGMEDVKFEDVVRVAAEATTPELQSQALQLAVRSAQPMSLADWLTGAHTRRAAGEVRALFPSVKLKSPEEVASEILSRTALAEQRQAKAAETRALQDDRETLLQAQAELARAKAIELAKDKKDALSLAEKEKSFRLAKQQAERVFRQRSQAASRDIQEMTRRLAEVQEAKTHPNLKDLLNRFTGVDVNLKAKLLAEGNVARARANIAGWLRNIIKAETLVRDNAEVAALEISKSSDLTTLANAIEGKPPTKEESPTGVITGEVFKGKAGRAGEEESEEEGEAEVFTEDEGPRAEPSPVAKVPTPPAAKAPAKAPAPPVDMSLEAVEERLKARLKGTR